MTDQSMYQFDVVKRHRIVLGKRACGYQRQTKHCNLPLLYSKCCPPPPPPARRRVDLSAALPFSGKLTSRFEESKSKYAKSTGKLHRAHNEYILLLREVALHQKHYLSNLLPALLDFQETAQQTMVKQW